PRLAEYDIRSAASADSIDAEHRWLDQWLAGAPDPLLVNIGLLTSAGDGVPDVVDRFLRAGADPSYRSRLGATPLKNAAGGGDAVIVERLVEAGLRLDTKDADVAASWAERDGHSSLAERLRRG